MSITQPDKIHLQETSDPQWDQMLALLRELREMFAHSAKDFNGLVKQAQEAGLHQVLYICIICVL